MNVLKFTRRIIWPETKVHRVHDKCIGRDLFETIFRDVADMPIWPLVKDETSHTLSVIFCDFSFKLYDKLSNLSIIDRDVRLLLHDNLTGAAYFRTWQIMSVLSV